MDCSLPGSSIHGIFQARILECVVIFFSRGIFPTQRLNPGLAHCRQTLYCLSHRGSPGNSAGKKSACNAGDPGSLIGLERSPGEVVGYPLQYSWASFVVLLVKNLPAMQETWFDPWVGKIAWRKKRLLTPVFWPGEFHGLYSLWGLKE